jgi:hypothetical protein
MLHFLRKWIVELIGTFFLVYIMGYVSGQEHLWQSELHCR